MEHRNPLSQGTQVNRFVIDRVIGYGASCLVYEAHYLDSGNHRKEIILKECYPYNSGTSRIGSKIVWSSLEEQEKAFQRFNNAYEIAARIQNEAGAQSVSVYSLDKFEENGTQYVATIPNGNSYDKTKNDDIADIIRTTLALTNAVGMYHKAGYLHLDIKPSNFIATEDQTGKGKNIVLFDVDTVVARDDIQSGNLRSVSYSKECAAPEQKMQQIKKMCPATDLYAVGAVLFERVMNRPANSSDSSMFATWEYDERFNAKKVNPKAKRLLTEIFHKTLAANVKRRYQSANELAKALDELLEVVSSKAPYILSTLPIGRCKFVGRNKEINELSKAIESKQKVFISGLGGIGKSELVKRYIDINGNIYDSIVFLTYSDTVKNTLSAIQISGVLKIDDKMALLPQLCNERTLIVLDNYDVAVGDDNTLNQLLMLDSSTIITTRTGFSEAYPELAHINLQGLSKENLRTVFENESQTNLSDKDCQLLNPVLHYGYQCTFYWYLLAAVYKNGAYELSELVQKAQEGLRELSKTEDVFSNKDGIRTKQTLAEAIFNLVKLEQLSKAEVEVLIILYFIDFLTLSKKQIREIFCSDSSSVVQRMNALNSLIEKRFIVEYCFGDGFGYKLSDVISDTVSYNFNPKIVDYPAVTKFIEKKFFSSKTKLILIDGEQHASQMHARYLFSRLFSFFVSLQPSNMENGIYFINLLFRMIGGYELLWNFAYSRHTKIIIDYLLNSKNINQIDALTKAKIYILLVSFYSNRTRTDFFEEIGEEEIKNGATMISYFREAVLFLSNNLDRKDILNELCMPIVSCTDQIQRCKLLEPDVIERIFEINPDCIQNERLSSFEIKVFRNPKFEEYYLRKVLDNRNTVSEQQMKEMLCDVLMRIFYNGICVSSYVDPSLRKLRKNAYQLCEDMLIGKNGTLTNDEYSPISHMGYIVFCESINIIPKTDDITSQKDVHPVENNENYTFKVCEDNQKDVFAKNAISKVRSFERKVYKELRKEKKRNDSWEITQKDNFSGLIAIYESIKCELEKEEVISAFPYYGEYESERLIDLKMDFCSASAIMFAVLHDYKNLSNKIQELLSLTDENLNNAGYDVIVDHSCDVESYRDVPLIRTFNVLSEYGYSDAIYTYVIDYVSTLERIFDIRETLISIENGEIDSFEESEELQAIIPYYELLIEITEKAIRSIDSKIRLLKALFNESDEHTDKSIKQLKELVEVYKLLLQKASGMEYH